MALEVNNVKFTRAGNDTIRVKPRKVTAHVDCIISRDYEQNNRYLLQLVHRGTYTPYPIPDGFVPNIILLDNTITSVLEALGEVHDVV
jgi:hypothetical protein